jgi:hypothetical protein
MIMRDAMLGKIGQYVADIGQYVIGKKDELALAGTLAAAGAAGLVGEGCATVGQSERATPYNVSGRVVCAHYLSPTNGFYSINADDGRPIAVPSGGREAGVQLRLRHEGPGRTNESVYVLSGNKNTSDQIRGWMAPDDEFTIRQQRAGYARPVFSSDFTNGVWKLSVDENPSPVDMDEIGLGFRRPSTR